MNEVIIEFGIFLKLMLIVVVGFLLYPPIISTFKPRKIKGSNIDFFLKKGEKVMFNAQKDLLLHFKASSNCNDGFTLLDGGVMIYSKAFKKYCHFLQGFLKVNKVFEIKKGNYVHVEVGSGNNIDEITATIFPSPNRKKELAIFVFIILLATLLFSFFL